MSLTDLVKSIARNGVLGLALCLSSCSDGKSFSCQTDYDCPPSYFCVEGECRDVAWKDIPPAIFPDAGADVQMPNEALTGKMVFTSNRDSTMDNYVQSFYILDLRTHEESLLLSGKPGNYKDFPAWSPNGQKIAFSADSGDGYISLYLVEVGTGNSQRITYDGDYFTPSWSPEGEKLACAFEQDPNDDIEIDIYIINSDGSNRQRLTTDLSPDETPQWSPSGDAIVFSSLRAGSRQIYTTNPDGSNQVNVTNTSYTESWPAWHPDGRKIAFTSTRDRLSGTGATHSIYVLDLDSGEQDNLTPDRGYALYARWSPDGNYIAFLSIVSGSRDIFVRKVGPLNTTLENITNNPAEEGLFDWTSK